jgi:hypothetical protein
LALSSMLFSRILSAQYLVWLVPFVAVLWVRGRRAVGWLAMAAGWLTFAYIAWFENHLIKGSKLVAALVVARNATLVVLLVVLVGAVRTARDESGLDRTASNSRR